MTEIQRRRLAALALAGLCLPGPGDPAAAQAPEAGGPLALPPALAAAPEALRREAAEAFAFCREGGGEPSVGEGFLREADLTGDGRADYVLDFAGLDCAGSPMGFCGPTGCLVTIWLAGTDTHRRAWGGFAAGVVLEGTAVVLRRLGTDCDPPAAPGEACEERMDFAGMVPPGIAEDGAEDAARAGPVPAPAPPAERPRPRPEAAGPAVPDPPAAGWSLRATPEGEAVAVSGGPGAIARAAAFCLGGEPFLALTLEPAPAAGTVAVGFAFPAAGANVEAEARREAGAGGAFVVALAEGPLAGLLAGRDGAVDVSLDGAAAGSLSLAGSTRAIRGALAPCHGF